MAREMWKCCIEDMLGARCEAFGGMVLVDGFSE
jgi:hypothetical protein